MFLGGGAVGHAHSKGARALLDNYCVGRLEGHEQEERADLSGLVDEAKPLVPQVGIAPPRPPPAWACRVGRTAGWCRRGGEGHAGAGCDGYGWMAAVAVAGWVRTVAGGLGDKELWR